MNCVTLLCGWSTTRTMDMDDCGNTGDYDLKTTPLISYKIYNHIFLNIVTYFILFIGLIKQIESTQIYQLLNVVIVTT